MSGSGLFCCCCPGKGLVAARLSTLVLNIRWILVCGRSSNLYKFCLTFHFTWNGFQYLLLRLVLCQSSWFCAFEHKSYLRALKLWLFFFTYSHVFVIVPDYTAGFCSLLFLFCLLFPDLVLQELHVLLKFCRNQFDIIWSRFPVFLLCYKHI